MKTRRLQRASRTHDWWHHIFWTEFYVLFLRINDVCNVCTNIHNDCVWSWFRNDENSNHRLLNTVHFLINSRITNNLICLHNSNCKIETFHKWKNNFTILCCLGSKCGCRWSWDAHRKLFLIMWIDSAILKTLPSKSSFILLSIQSLK